MPLDKEINVRVTFVFVLILTCIVDTISVTYLTVISGRTVGYLKGRMQDKENVT
jgi:hypothetical protein